VQQNQGHSLNMHAFMYQQQVLPYAAGRLRIVQKSAKLCMHAIQKVPTVDE
jgi:hypothetical protein